MIDIQVSQTFILSRILAGKVWEGWQLITKAYFATKVSTVMGDALPEKAKDALKELKRYFNTKNVIGTVRNEFAFHYDPSRIQNQLAAIDEGDDLKIYIAEKEANLFYQMSEIVVGSAMLEAVKPGDFGGANERLMSDVMEKSRQVISFCDGCLEYLADNYLGGNSRSLHAEEIELPDPPARDDILLPFFAQ